jgi:pyrroloquinoline-quinone synthase
MATDLLTSAPVRDELQAMSPEEFVTKLRESMREEGLAMSDHPIVAGLEAGSVTLPQMRFWTEQFYLHIRNMLPWIGEIYVRCPYEDVRAALVKNLAEEALGTWYAGKSHPDLLLDFAAAIGGNPDAMRAAEQVPASRKLTDYFEFMATRRPWFVALAAVGIGLESFVPEAFTRMVAAFKDQYGLSDEQVRFWSVHIVADEEHGDEGIEIVENYATTTEDRRVVFDCTMETTRLFRDLWNLYRTVD